jgi:ABC-2 type transport system permease protein
MPMNRFIDRYLGFTLNAVQSFWTYRFRMLIWIVFDFVVLGVQYFLWTAIFASTGGNLFGIGLPQYLSYVGLGLLIGRITGTDLDGNVAQDIKRGDIAMGLIKPVSYFGMVAAQRLGGTVGSLVAMLPVTLVIAFFIGFPPVPPGIAAAGVLSIVLSYVLVTIFSFLLGILAFWITNYWGLFLFKQHIIALFSGEVIALNLLFQFGSQGIPNFPIPGVAEGTMKALFTGLGIVSYCLPFQAMSYTPSAILTGMIVGPGAVAGHLALQGFWILALGLLTAWAWGRAQRRVTILGG